VAHQAVALAAGHAHHVLVERVPPLRQHDRAAQGVAEVVLVDQGERWAKLYEEIVVRAGR